MVQKSRVLGVSNAAIFCYTNSFYVTTSIIVLVGICGTLIPSFILCGVGTFVVGCIIDKHEKDTSELLVNYLDQVEVKKSRRRRKPSAITK